MRAIAGLLVTCGTVLLAAAAPPPAPTPAAAPAPAPAQPATPAPTQAAATAPDAALANDLYQTRLADCMACHTQPGGTPFAGGREIPTPYGTLTSPNITPDPDTGIGKWTDAEFYRALHDGIGHGGEYLYPVMPYPSYTKMTHDDVEAIKNYLFSLKPVFAPRAPSHMAFPYDIRASLLVWRELYFEPGTYVPNPAHSAAWNRGAYIVEGAGHCGACHSPRNVLGATEIRDSLAGGQVQQWLAPNISSDPLDGIGKRSISDIVTFLRTGATHSMGVAFGPMAEVVHDSLHYATDSDLEAIATYLKEGPDRPGPKVTDVATLADLHTGQQVYLANCAGCHQDNGRGITGVIPNLAGNAAIAADRPTDLLAAILQGLPASGNSPAMPSFAGALDDRSIADVANYVRSAWHDQAPADVSTQMVADERAHATTGAAGSEAARDFDCPRVGPAAIKGAFPVSADANFLAQAGNNSLDQRIDLLVAGLRQKQPGASDATIANEMAAAICPSVADRTDMSTAAKRAMLLNLDSLVQERIAATAPLPAGDKVLEQVPLSPAQMQRATAAAVAHHETTSAYLAGLIPSH